MKTLKNDWLMWLIILSPFVLIGLKWNSFPEQVPTHWNLKGEVDDYSSKITGLVLMPGINILLYFVFLALPFIDPQRKNYALFSDKFKILRILIHTFLSFITFVVCAVSLGYDVNVSVLIQTSVLVLMMVFGNFMGNIRPNYFVGIRTPWTLANQQVWTMTHRFAGVLWVAASALMLVLSFVIRTHFEVFFIAYLAVICALPILYSFIKFRQVSAGKES